ncbi:MAG: ABC transporter permease [Saprospiraceae bacterium]|nr:ABC transporter permease [Saprospiraceae bacterium]
MRIILRILYESFDQAFHQLRSNKLRSFLSLLGITIGIFCIIAVMSAVDSLEDNIKGSFEQLGNDVIYISKLPWAEDSRESYWKYFQRPVPSFEDYEAIKTRVKTAGEVSLLVRIGGRTIKYRSNNVEGAFVMAVTFEYADIFNLKLSQGRFYSPFEYEHGSDRVILGASIAEELFGALDPIGKDVKLMGKSLQVIGVIEKSGKSIVNPLDHDEAILLSYTLAKKMSDVRMRNNPWGTQLNIKADERSDVSDLKDEVTGVLRAHHRLKPRESDDFSINEISVITQLLDKVFGVLNIAGWLIGVFAILVGMFSVANIMFVSVKERTNIIGIKKALGAKRLFIRLEFLIESVVLCILGGLFGLLIVFLLMKILTQVMDFELFLSVQNIVIGLTLSIIIGVLAGLIPANQASKLDPVEAMRK